ncbi:MAG: ABC-type transport auxiliary lipoprotein family protein [Desulfovibrionales bacterium]|nr:ABC-type transport auxiliary lipoprotein family protein [Desulfovibrionales bacterium]
MRMYLPFLSLLTSCLLLGGCAIDLGLTPPPASNHYLLAVSTTTPAQTAMHKVPTISIDRPQANAFLNSTGIAVIKGDQKVLYYADGQWATVLPEMMQSAVIRALNGTQQVRAFNNEQPGITADYNLIWSIEDFYASYGEDKAPPQIMVTLNCWLVDNITGTTVATSVFADQQEADELALDPIIVSFNAAVEALLQDMSNWAVQQITAAESKHDRSK